MPTDNVTPGNKGFQRIPLPERFWKKVNRRNRNECWPWTGSKDQHGYGQIHVDGQRRRATHVSWELENVQPFPKGMDACHSCDNPNCVNPEHIWPGTKKENALDCITKGRKKLTGPCLQNAEKVVCSRGHAFDEENTYVSPKGDRICKTCRRVSDAAWKKQKRLEKAARHAIAQEQRMTIENKALKALRIALQFADRSAGEGIHFLADGDSPAMDAADVCVAVSEVLGIDFAGPEYSALVDAGLLPELISLTSLDRQTGEREGWVLVPVEPTLEMLDKAREAPIGKSNLTYEDWVHGTEKEDCPGLGITWPDFPYDRHATVNEETSRILLTTWWKAMALVASGALPAAPRDADRAAGQGEVA